MRGHLAPAGRVASSMMALHVAANGESLPTTSLRTFVWLLASVAVCVDLQAGRSAESLVARRADISIL